MGYRSAGLGWRFALGLVGRGLLALAAFAALAYTILRPDLGAARLVAAALAAAAAWLLWDHVNRTNRMVARFVEAVGHGDFVQRFDTRGGSGFDRLGQALNAALDRLRAARDADADTLRFTQALLDDTPIALLLVEGGQVTLANKAARQLFREHGPGNKPGDFALYGATFAKRLTSESAPSEETLLLTVEGRPQRAIVRTGELKRLAGNARVVTVQPAQGAFDAIEMAAQSDLVRVLTHEILNSLTPITSLAGTAAALLDDDRSGDPAREDARLAVATLARRTEGLTHFIESYRAVARAPHLDRRPFEAEPWAAELARLFAADWPQVPLERTIVPADLALDADPDLLAQVLINLLRNAAEAASAHGAAPRVAFRMARGASGIQIEVEDNGPGVPERLRQDIFLPFFTTRAKGTGVGLNLARQIVVAHGGAIEVADGAEGGALFRIEL